MVLAEKRMINILVFCNCLFPFFRLSETKISTACSGIPGIGGCIVHRFNCTDPLVISIYNITFGYRPGCSPLSSCSDTTCCREEIGDCFTPYSQTLLSQLQQTCNGRSTCTLNSKNGLDEYSSFCGFGNIFHSYSKIEYQCSIIGSTAPAETADRVEELTVVGGVLGSVIAICIVIIVILVIYFNSVLTILNRRLSILNSELHQNDHQYDSAPSRSRDESPAVYDALNTGQQNGDQQQNVANEPTRSSNDTQHSTIDNGDAPVNQNYQQYEHPYDAAPRGETVQPAVYASLNTREQTGYYNMGNNNTVSR